MMTMTPSLQSRDRRRSAFTLIEVLIALGLSVVLLSAVYASLQMLYQFQQAGRTEIRISQIQRSLTRLLTEDLGSVVMQIPEETTDTSTGQAADSSGTTGTGSSSSSSSSGSSTGSGSSSSTIGSSPTTLSGVDDSGVPLTFGLVGDAEAFHLTVSKPARGLAYDSESGRLSDLQLVSWGLAPLPPDYMQRRSDVTVSNPPKEGLGRRALDLLSTGGVDAVLLEQDLIAPEITEVTFEFFDGAIWVQDWDSQLIGALPRAIRVTFGYWIEPQKPRGYQGTYVAKPIIQYEVHVIPVPMTEPYVDDTGL